jgi:uncharacterized protein (UPF0303 family)
MGLPIVVGRKFHHDAIGKSNKGTSFMVPNPDLDGLIQRETRLILRRFTPDDAWWLGCFLRNAGHKAQAPIAVEITVGQTTLFSMLLAGATADNLGWIKRKVAVAWRYQLSSYVMNQSLPQTTACLNALALTTKPMPQRAAPSRSAWRMSG